MGRNKRLWQGMEHLKTEMSSSDVDSHLTDMQSNDNRNNKEFILLKKELVFVVVIMSFLFLTLVGLMVYDKNAGGLAAFAEKVASIFTNSI